MVAVFLGIGLYVHVEGGSFVLSLACLIYFN